MNYPENQLGVGSLKRQILELSAKNTLFSNYIDFRMITRRTLERRSQSLTHKLKLNERVATSMLSKP